MARQRIWLSYDLGVRGDYVGLYNWLDTHKAKECGDSVATLIYEHEGGLAEELTSDLRRAVETTARTRFYVMFRDDETEKIKGIFLFGNRRGSAWTGYAAGGETVDDEAVS